MNVLRRVSKVPNPTPLQNSLYFRKASIFSQVDLNKIQPINKTKLKNLKYLASSYMDFPEFLNYEHHPQMNCLRYEGNKKDLKTFGNNVATIINETRDNTRAWLFKGTPIKTVQDFDEVLKYADMKQMVYVSGNASRESVSNLVYEASDEPPELSIDCHNEMAYMPRYPPKIMFCCITPPIESGETAVVFNEELTNHLNPSFLQKVYDKKIRYIRHHNSPEKSNYMTWIQVFKTESRKEVEEILSESNSSWEWQTDGSLKSWHTSEGFIKHPFKDEKIWFNQLHAAHNTYYLEHPDYYQRFDIKDQLPLHTTFGDGEEFALDDIHHIREVQWRLARGFKWEQGDILLLDNRLAQHGRLSFTGDRKLVVSLIK